MKPCICCKQEGTYGVPRWGYATCRVCGLERNDPFPTIEEIVQHYEGRAEGGNYNIEAISVFDSFRKGVFRSGFERLQACVPGALKGQPVLDVGCFTGLSLEVIRDAGAVPFGIELQQDAAKIAEQKFPGRVFSCDICRELPFHERFAAVTLTDVLEHLHDPLLALLTLRESMVEGGHILFTTPNSASVVAKLMGKYWFSRCPIHHIYLFNPANVTKLLNRAGFEVVEIRPLTKRLSLEYVGWIIPKLSPSLGWVMKLVPKAIQKVVLPLRGGEMVIVAKRTDARPAL